MQPAEAERLTTWGSRIHRLGSAFCRHNPIEGRFILKFSCAKARLYVESDGDARSEPNPMRYAEPRTETLAARGYPVALFTRADGIANLEALLGALAERAYPRPSLPYKGGGGCAQLSKDERKTCLKGATDVRTQA